MDPTLVEQMTGLRFTYSLLPTFQEQLESLNIPLSIHCTPLKQTDDLKQAYYKPVICQCGSILNCYSKIDFTSQKWFCQMCNINNKLPSYYLKNSQQEDQCYELSEENQIIEYNVSDLEKIQKSNFVFLIDTCVTKSNMEKLKTGLIEAVEQIDFTKNSVSLVTFNRNVFVYKNTNSSELIQSIMIPPFANAQQRDKLLNFGKLDEHRKNVLYNKYFFEDKQTLKNVLENLETDFWSTPVDERSQRSTGKALELVLDLLSQTGTISSRIILFVSGPCTYSEGRVADLKIKNFVRKFADLEDNKEARELIQQALTYYKNLTQRAKSLQTCLDIFAYSLDQFGLYEMRNLSSKTGGIIIMNEEFKQDHFRDNIKKYFESKNVENQFLKFHSRGILTLRMSQHLKICGGIGNFSSLNTKPFCQGDNKIGENNTDTWYLGGLDHLSTYLFFFEIAAKNSNQAFKNNDSAYIQFITRYHHNSGALKIRVQTYKLDFLKTSKSSNFIEYLDQFAIISTYAKIAALRSLEQDSSFVRRYLDSKLINILKNFKNQNDVPESLNLLPQYFYYLRKSLFVSKFASSLDESFYYRHSMLRQNTDNTLVMIQPQVIEYSLNNQEPVPVLPDLDCLKKDVILLADTFFNIIIWKGSTINSWIKEGYQFKEGYEYFKTMMEMPEEDASFIVEERLIVPN